MRILSVLIVLCLLSGCGNEEPTEVNPGGQSSEVNANTPQEVFTRFQKAAADEDFGGAVACLSPDAREELAMLVTIPIGMMVAFDPSKEADIKKLLSEHGIDLNDKETGFDVTAIPDKQAFLVAVMTWMKENSTDDRKQESAFPHAEGELGAVTIDGEFASAQLTRNSGRTEDVQFARVDGTWYLTLPSNGGLSLNDDGGDDLADDDWGDGGGGFGGFGEPDPPVAAIPADEFDAHWKTNLEATEQPAGELLTQLAEEIGVELEVRFNAEDKVGTKVSLAAEQRSYLQTIDEICKQAGVHPEFDFGNLTIADGPIDSELLYSGPFRFVMSQPEVDAANATATIQVAAATAGVSKKIAHHLNENGVVSLEFDPVTNPAGESLARNSNMFGMSGSINPVIFRQERTIGLKNLLRDIETVRIAGKVDFELPTEVAVLKFDSVKAGQTASEGDVSLTLKKVSPGGIEVTLKGVEFDALQFNAFDTSGKPMNNQGHSYFGTPQRGTATVNYGSAPGRLEVRMVTATASREFSFEFDDVMIPERDQRPEQLENLEFDGDTPVMLEFQKFTGDDNFRRLQFKATNHSNKDVEIANLKIEYLDDAQKPLKESSGSNQGKTIPAGDSIELEVAAFFMPDEATGVRATVSHIEFADADEWKATP